MILDAICAIAALVTAVSAFITYFRNGDPAWLAVGWGALVYSQIIIRARP